MKVYLDNAATTAVEPEVLNEMLPYFTDRYYNPSASYNDAISVYKHIQNARGKVARLINADSSEIFFTSCGSESNAWVMRNVYDIYNDFVLTSCIEHPSVKNNIINSLSAHVSNDGIIDIKHAEYLLTQHEKDIALCSMMCVNNEVGTIQPIEELSELAHKHNKLFHTDGVQAVGNVKINVKELPYVHFLSMSGHKIGAPKGIGALYIKKDVQHYIKPLINGGGQERRFRSGTENVTGIIGFGKAAELAFDNIDKNHKHKTALFNLLKNNILNTIDDVIINGNADNHTYILNVSFKKINGEALALLLSDKGICVSNGSACHAKDGGVSDTLAYMNVPKEYINGTLRLSIGNHNTEEEIEYVIKHLKESVEFLRRIIR